MQNIIQHFYESFARLDAAGMASCYHENIQFTDPAFGSLQGEAAKNMWRMLCESQKGQDFRIEYSGIECTEDTGKAHWEAFYTFSRTGRKVHNKINARFRLQDGKIIEHIDHFNLHRWAGQAMGFTGYLIGWTPYFKKQLNKQTNRLLEKYVQSQSQH
jgi:ketosteroid isomerase-like protein